MFIYFPVTEELPRATEVPAKDLMSCWDEIFVDLGYVFIYCKYDFLSLSSNLCFLADNLFKLVWELEIKKRMYVRREQ